MHVDTSEVPLSSEILTIMVAICWSSNSSSILSKFTTWHSVIRKTLTSLPICIYYQYGDINCYSWFFFFELLFFSLMVYTLFSLVQSLSRVRLFVTPWIVTRQATLSIIKSWSSLKLNVHRVSDAIQPSHPMSSPSPPAPHPSQHQSLFQWVNSSHEVANTGVSALASFLPKNTQDWSPSEWTGWISLQSKGLSRVFSNTTVQKHQCFTV